MALSVRSQLKTILDLYNRAQEMDDKKEAYKQANEAVLQVTVLAGKDGAPIISYNLAGDLMLQQHKLYIDTCLVLPDKSNAKTLKHLAYKMLDKSVMYYRMASKKENRCILTAVKHSRALIAASRLDDAKRELERAKLIDCPVDPMLHNVEVTRDHFNKEELIAYTKKRIESELLYIEVAKRDSKFAKILEKLGDTRVQAHSILKAAAQLADAQPHSVRVKLLYPHLVICLLITGRLNDRRRGESFSHALRIVKDLSTLAPRSLVVSLVHVKLLVALGFFDDSEKECARALQIDKPDDPWEHDIPLGSTSGGIYDDRVRIKRQEIACIIDTIVTMVKVEFNKLSEEHKGCFLSVRVIDLFNHSDIDSEKISAATEAIEWYKLNHSWVHWRCPVESCASFETADSSSLLHHVWCTHFCAYFATEEEIHFSTVNKILQSVNFVPFSGHHEDLYIARDIQGDDYVCVRSMDCIFDWARKMLPVLAGEEHDDCISPNDALQCFLNCLKSFNEDENGRDALEAAWRQLLSSWAIDSRGALLDLTANIKWIEMKAMVEELIVKIESAGTDAAETPTDESMLEMKAQEVPSHESMASMKGSKRRSQHHAFKYEHDALHRRCAMVLAPSPVQKPQVEGSNDVYFCKKIHIDFMHDVAKAKADKSKANRELCSSCYFERGSDRFFTQILHHFVQLHGGGVKCLICSVRFVSAIALSYHIQYCHNVDAESQKTPVQTIASNAGVEGAVIVGKLSEQENADLGYDAAKGEYVDMVKAGITDPLKVIRTALIDEASVSSLMTTTESVIVESPKEESSSPARD